MDQLTRTNPTELAEWAGDIDEVSWVPPEDMTYDQWVEAGTTLQQINRSVGWWIGDWLTHGESKWGEKYAQAIEYTDTSIETLKKYAAVSARLPRDVRQRGLSWTHHFNVAYLPEEERGPVLELAANFDLSSREIHAIARMDEADRAILMDLWVNNPEMEAGTFLRYFQQIQAGEYQDYELEDLPFTEMQEPDEDSLPDFIDPIAGEPPEEIVSNYWRLRGLPLRFTDRKTAQWDGIVVRATVDEGGMAVLEWEIVTEEEDGYYYSGK